MRPRRTWLQRGVLTVNLLAITAALGAAWILDQGEDVAASIPRIQLENELTPRSPEVEGQGRSFNVLLVGYDSAANLDPDDPIQIGRQGEQAGDVIIVARIDETDQTAQLLSFPRDLWVPIAGRDTSAKINSAFAVGGAGMLIDTIEENFDIPINNFVSVDLSGFEGLVEVVGHVDLHFEHPARDFNDDPPSGEPRNMSGFQMPETGCQSLDPTNALAFARSRNFQVFKDGEWVYDGRDDLARIRRQQLFLEAFLARAISLGARNPFTLQTLIEEGVEHVTLDQELTPQMMLDIGRAFDSFDSSQLESYSVPTRYALEGNGTISVLYALDEELEPLLAVMRGADTTDPTTVGIEVRVDAAAADEAERLAASLGARGFATAEPLVVSGLTQGLELTHGPDGRQAASLVAEAIVSDGGVVGRIVETADVVGRQVVVRIGATEVADTPPDDAPTTTVPTNADSTTTTTTVPTTALSTTTAVSTVTPPEVVTGETGSVRICD